MLNDGRQQHLTDPIDYNGVRRVSVMSVILPENIVQHAMLFFWQKSVMEAPNGTSHAVWTF